MTILKSFIVTLALLICAGLALAEATRRAAPTKTLNAADLERLATGPSVEQAILRAAAAKLRQDKTATGTVELQVTVNTTTLPAGCGGQICVWSGGHRICARAVPCYYPD
jgi:hypothetical protein